jgi:hypothetical protein
MRRGTYGTARCFIARTSRSGGAVASSVTDPAYRVPQNRGMDEAADRHPWTRCDTLVNASSRAMAWGGVGASCAIVAGGGLLERHTDWPAWGVWWLLLLTAPLAIFGASLIVRRARWHVHADGNAITLAIEDAAGRTWKRETFCWIDVRRAVWTEAASEYPTGLTLLGDGRRRLRLPVELVDEMAARELVARFLPAVPLERSR